jgi:hypothetical protein
MKKLLAILLFTFTFSLYTHVSGQVAINNSATNPDASAILDLNSGNTGVNKGLLPPQVALSATNVAAPVTSPATGLIVYNTATAGTSPYNVIPAYYYWNGSQWMLLMQSANASGSGWALLGNSGTTRKTNFIGTTDNTALVFKVNNYFSGIIDDSLNNTYFCYHCGMTNVGKSGHYNAAFGLGSMNQMTTGYVNAAFGNGALYRITSGLANTAVGADAMGFDSSGQNNVAVGSEALYYSPYSIDNTAIGTQAMYFTTTGSYNTATGGSSMLWNTTGNNNTATGYFALIQNNIGNNNSAFGYEALDNNTSGINNTAVGYNASNINQKASSNTAVGANALYYNKSDAITAVGDSALNSNTTGTQNTAVGYRALTFNTTGYENTAIGNVALSHNATGYENTAVGEHALDTNTTGYDNTAVGDDGLNLNTTGNENTAIGEGAMFNNTIGNLNTTVGYQSLNSNTIGGLNTSVGAYALSSTSNSLTDNTAIGYNAMNSATGGANTACGESTLWDVFGDYNVALGYQAGYDHVGYYNVAIGAISLNNVSGQYNSVLGYGSTVNPGTLDNATAIGANSLATSSNSVVLGSNAVTQTQFNGALMPYYSSSYNAGTSGQVLTSQGANVAPQWVNPKAAPDSSVSYVTGAQTFVNNSNPLSTTTAGYACTTSMANVPSATITLSVNGTYLLIASADCGSVAYSTGQGVGIALTDGTNYWGSALAQNPGFGYGQFGWVAWSTTTVVTVSGSTTYNIQALISSAGSGYVRNARVTAMKLN